jgi:hypothetical protein
MFSEAAWLAWRDHVTAASIAAIKSDTENILTNFPIEFPPPPVIPPMAPVWPGPGGVVFYTPAALVDQLHLTGTMDGVIIAVTTPPTRVGQYQLGGVILDYGVGRIAFETDSGDIEPWQYLGFRAAIYTPKSMAHANGVRLQVLGGAEGTVTPWTIAT